MKKGSVWHIFQHACSLEFTDLWNLTDSAIHGDFFMFHNKHKVGIQMKRTPQVLGYIHCAAKDGAILRVVRDSL